MVGTAPFMAIDALESYVKDNPRTYHPHDLEAFFYVFIYLAMCPRRENGTKVKGLSSTSRPLKRKLDKRQQFRKTENMGREGVQNILGEFTPELEDLKGLAQKFEGYTIPNEGW